MLFDDSMEVHQAPTTKKVVKYGEKDGFLYNNCHLSNLPAPSNMSLREGWEGL